MFNNMKLATKRFGSFAVLVLMVGLQQTMAFFKLAGGSAPVQRARPPGKTFAVRQGAALKPSRSLAFAGADAPDESQFARF